MPHVQITTIYILDPGLDRKTELRVGRAARFTRRLTEPLHGNTLATHKNNIVLVLLQSYLFEFNQVNNTHTISHRINMDQKENLCLAKLIYYIVTSTLDMAKLLLKVYNKQN